MPWISVSQMRSWLFMRTCPLEHGKRWNTDWTFFQLHRFPTQRCTKLSVSKVTYSYSKVPLSSWIRWRSELSWNPGGTLWSHCICHIELSTVLRLCWRQHDWVVFITNPGHCLPVVTNVFHILPSFLQAMIALEGGVTLKWPLTII